ncbi:ribonuclease Z [Staphylococcus sp. SQ8-PEA]|uniref:Ribonuclease Z n=1 Tax=Staphylococcus marylandisciuri TaxID=2981529 RepID=A0ABT2QNA2_9STAP|nr:ribonuclease Z [Staphylococcus marylandisciuri]MCU5745455.1 ribonuclease Z [Staphylococcus marylandisciuri]
MEITFLGTSAGLPTKERNTQAVALNLAPYSNHIWLFDVGEGTQHQILHHSIKLGKVDHIFLTHMHGDHIFGLPGILTSRSFQGGEGKPLTIVGPKGIKEFVETTLRLSASKLNYPITFIEIDNELSYQHHGFEVSAHLLNHGIASYGYRIEAPSTPGTIDVAALKEIGLEPGPKYQQVKTEETFEHNGHIYDSTQFKGPEKLGPTIAIFGDTKPCPNEKMIAHHADIMVHEGTYLEGDKTLANNYFHSHIDDVFHLVDLAQVKHTLVTHISNRYNIEEVDNLKEKLKEEYGRNDFNIVKDFDVVEF